ncbi:MAG: mevalonate kinase, partial [Bacteroidota bacterium]
MRNYPAKILLFGEYTIISGGMALAIPYHKFNGHWQYAKVSEDRHKLQQELSDFTTYLESLHYEGQLLCELDIDAIWDELERGLFFQSDIPIGYGAGSSGAFCAAFYDRFVRHKLDGQQLAPLKAQLAQLESFFHGSSSGLDPLVCYLDQTLLFEEGQ